MHTQETTPYRSWRRLAWAAAAILTLALGWIIWHVTAFAMAHAAYGNESLRIWNTINTLLRERRPQQVSPDEWNATIGWALTAQVNIFSSPENTSFQSMKKFGEQLDEKMRNENDSFTTEWFENQFEQTGPYGKQYIRRFRPMVHDHIQAIRRKQDQK